MGPNPDLGPNPGPGHGTWGGVGQSLFVGCGWGMGFLKPRAFFQPGVWGGVARSLFVSFASPPLPPPIIMR